jgi:hypothetical protein
MSGPEVAMFKKYLDNASDYSEFGSGGSTCLVNSMQTIKTVVSIENDRDFRNKVQAMCPRCDVRWVNTGKTGPYGHVSNNTEMHLWPNYSSADIGTPDTILIDGRFRVACGLQCCIKHPNATILMHDFTNRPEYHVLLNYMDIVKSVDTLVCVKVKLDNDKEKLLELYDTYKFIQD